MTAHQFYQFPVVIKGWLVANQYKTKYLFYRIDQKGQYIGLGDFHGAWRRCLKLLGIQNFRFHDTRHMQQLP
jgi:integrase